MALPGPNSAQEKTKKRKKKRRAFYKPTLLTPKSAFSAFSAKSRRGLSAEYHARTCLLKAATIILHLLRLYVLHTGTFHTPSHRAGHDVLSPFVIAVFDGPPSKLIVQRVLAV